MTATDPDGNTSEFSNERAISLSACDTTTKTTNDTTPSMSGTITASGFSTGAGNGPTMTLQAASQTVTGTIDTTASTQSVADNTFTPIAEGTYDTLATFTDPETTMTTTSSKTAALTIDTTAPTVSILQAATQPDPTNVNAAVFTITASEALSSLTAGNLTLTGTTTGSVSSLTTTDNITYQATVTGMTDGDTVSLSLAAGTVTDLAGNGNTASNEGNPSADTSVTYDATSPTGTINPLTTFQDSPQLTGTVSDPAATISLLITDTATSGSRYSHSFTATNNTDGSWTLPLGTITPPLTPGTYNVTATFTDAATNSSVDPTTNELTIQRPDADLPTVDPLTSTNGQPVITGTYDGANSQSLRVRLNNVWYVLGTNTELTSDPANNTWTLDLSHLTPPLPDGSYDITVEVTTRSGQTLSDSSRDELKVQQPTTPTNPLDAMTDELGETGGSVSLIAVGGILLVMVGWKLSRRTSST